MPIISLLATSLILEPANIFIFSWSEVNAPGNSLIQTSLLMKHSHIFIFRRMEINVLGISLMGTSLLLKHAQIFIFRYYTTEYVTGISLLATSVLSEIVVKECMERGSTVSVEHVGRKTKTHAWILNAR